MSNQVRNFQYTGKHPGPHLVITGAVHGNEPCGPRAIQRVMDKLIDGDITITTGQLTLIPLCNPAAYKKGTRYYERNMNRHFYPKDAPDTYEDRLINELAPCLEKADYLLDIHSYHSGGPPFVFVDKGDNESQRLARMLGVRETIAGFAQAYANAGIDQSKWTSMGTTEYVRMQNGHALTLECGQHGHPQSVEVAWRAVLGVLYHLGMAAINGAPAGQIPEKAGPQDLACTQASQVVYKRRTGHLRHNWQHLERIAPGSAIAEYSDGTLIHAPADATRIIMPDPECPVGEEWFYLGRETVLTD